MAPPLPLRFVMSSPTLAGLPPTRAEVAFAGRSNVGKSSLVNALANRKSLAMVSKTPGRTRLLNFYDAGGGASLVDLPGYGYAAAAAATRSTWPRMVEGYLTGREELAMVAVLVDGEIGPTKLDLQVLWWLRDEIVPHTVVATKQDKVRSSHRPKRARELAEACLLEPGDVVWVSAHKGVGIERLRDLYRMWTAP